MTGILIVILVIFSLSITPKGSEIWMDSVAKITGVWGLKCGSIQSKTAILLPGGVVWLRDGSRVMTQWSEVRVNAITEDIKQGKISKVIIPGGYVSGNLNEGLRLKIEIGKRLNKNTIKKIDIQTGKGSRSTVGNFTELLPLLDKKMDYWLYTSDWHMYRAFYVAKKMGITVCPVIIKNPHEEQKFYTYPWKLKAAVREYIAIVWYAIKGKI